MRDDKGAGRQGARGDRAARVEAKPAEPEQRGAQHDHGRVVRLELLLAETEPPAEDQGAHQGRDARADMHHSATGEVDRTEAAQQTGLPRAAVDRLSTGDAGAAPYPVGDRVVHHRRPDQGEQDERLVAHALGEGTGDQGRRDHGEHGLEDHVGLVRHRRAVVGIRSQSDAVQAPPGKAAEHAAADIWTERQAVDPQGPLHADDADNDEALHDGGQGVFAADQPAVEERQARGHQQDQG